MLDDLGFDYVGNLFQSHAEDWHVIYFDAVFNVANPNRRGRARPAG